MMYMSDAIRATVQLMEAPAEKLNIWSSYNLSGISFTPEQIAMAIADRINNFSIDYKPDFRDKIAQSWPSSINDDIAKADWNWKSEFNLDAIVKDMITNLTNKLQLS